MSKSWLLLALALGVVGSVPLALADRDGHERHERRSYEERGYEGREEDDDDDREHGRRRGGDSSHRVTLDAGYVTECGACHVAYPPGMLPERSWRKMMGDLAHHFGENAELDQAAAQRLEGYLVQASGEGGSKFARSVPSGMTPLRLTETPKFRSEHDELRGPVPVKSMAQCEACHTRAKEGSYEEREIVVPGQGRWEK